MSNPVESGHDPVAIVASGVLPADVQSFLSGSDPSTDAILSFLDGRTSPITGPGWALFFWRGHAEAVELLRWIHSGVDRGAFVQVPQTDTWVLRIPVVDNGRFEYKLSVRHHGHESWILDPANPARAADPFGENSVCCTWGYAPPEWTEPQGAPRGRIEEFTVPSEAFGEERRENIYLPHGYTGDKPLPLVVAHDGDDYDAYASLSTSLDNLIAAGDIPPLAVVLVQTRDRMDEYARGRRHARYLVQDLLPAVTRKYAISDDARDRVLMGASLGAVASLSTAFRFPGVFGGLVLKSGTFILNQGNLENRDHPVFRRTARLSRALERAPDLPKTRAFVSTGELEGLADENAAIANVLREHGVDVLFKSAWDGHHWHNWRNQLRDGLTWVFRKDDAAS
jgi:enterochelin esterase family protein